MRGGSDRAAFASTSRARLNSIAVTIKHQQSNLESWSTLRMFVESLPATDQLTPWKNVARRFLVSSVDVGLNRYFRAGQSMFDLVFSTLDHHGLVDEPRVIVVFLPPDRVRLAFFRERISAEAEYTLDFDAALPTFRRFLNQLWASTMPEAIPSELRPVTAPVLTKRGTE